MRACEFLLELSLSKNKWTVLISNGDKEEVGSELIDLVHHAYTNTPEGSFIHSLRDVIPSDWNIVDWDKDPDVDACMFYREPRPNESWFGNKIQGIGHDGQRGSKDRVLEELEIRLNTPGWWIESSDAMRHILSKRNVPIIIDEALLQRLFPNTNLRMIDEYTYQRQLNNNRIITESVFGRPILK